METSLPDESRVSLESTTSHNDFNRIHLDAAFRDKILAEFENDSSESLPLPVTISSESLASNAPQNSTSAPQSHPLSSSPPSKAKATSRLNQVVQSSDIPTPDQNQGSDYFGKKDSRSSGTPVDGNADLTPTVSSTKRSSLSKIVTAEDGEGKDAKASRPGTIRRLTSRIKRTISSKG